jgi:hypothetical protein
MANKLAVQRMKYTKAFADYGSTEDEAKKQSAIRRMAEVLHEAPEWRFTEQMVTQGVEPPGEVRRLIAEGSPLPVSSEVDEDQLAREIEQRVDKSDLREVGSGIENVYAYGYQCAPDRLKIGKCEGDVISRITTQISTSAPDRPSLSLIIHTHDCSALERVIHGVLPL